MRQRKKYNKLVHNKIPNIIETQGQTAVVKELDDEAYGKELLRKLREEVDEFSESKSLEELADDLEVVLVISTTFSEGEKGLHLIRRRKKIAQGGFEKRIFLVEVTSH